MKPKLDQALTKVALGVMTGLASLSVQAAPAVYQIVNYEIDQTLVEVTEEDGTKKQVPTNAFVIKGSLANTQRGYGVGVSEDGTVIGTAQGRKNLDEDQFDDENDDFDFDLGVSPDETIIYSVTMPIVANNFTFTLAGAEWTPTFDSLGGSVAPDATVANGVDAAYYSSNHLGDKVGVASGSEQTHTSTDDEGEAVTWYYRAFESRGYVKTAAGVETALLPAAETLTYTTEDGELIETGGLSIAANIAESAPLVVGAASIAFSSTAESNLESCVENKDNFGGSVDVCVQNLQFNNQLSYHSRGAIWDLSSPESPVMTALPLGFTPDADSTTAYSGQALGVNDEGIVVGRTYGYYNGDTDRLNNLAVYWTKDPTTATGYAELATVIPMPDDEYYNTLALDINNDGIILGTYERYIDGYLRTKFFTYDINSPQTPIKTINDVNGQFSDIETAPSKANGNYVVGTMDSDGIANISRTKSGFIYDLEATGDDDRLYDLNDLLTCESKSYESDGESWKPREVTVTDSTGKELTYTAEVRIAQASAVSSEAGYIVGTALVRQPVFQLDDSGQPTQDFELNAAGNPLTAFVSKAVVLQKVTKATACDYTPPESDDAPFERQGAAAWWLMLLAPLAFWRRRQR